MGKIIRNGIKYSAATEAALNINYNNTDSKMAASTVQGAIDELSRRVVNITQAEYDALGDYKYTNNVLYHITDAEGGGDFSGAAADVSYDNTESELEATNVQDALDILSGRLVKLTQEEYDALTEEEKQDNVYFVTDGEISGESSSTEEPIRELDFDNVIDISTVTLPYTFEKMGLLQLICTYETGSYAYANFGLINGSGFGISVYGAGQKTGMSNMMTVYKGMQLTQLQGTNYGCNFVPFK